MTEERKMAVETMMLDGRKKIVLDPQDYEALLDARDHSAGMADAATFGTLRDDEMDEFLAAPSPLAFWRRRAGKTQAELAEGVGITQPFLAQMENGRRVGTVQVLIKLARSLGVGVEDLVDVS